MSRRPSVTEELRLAWPRHRIEALAAYDLLVEHCGGNPPPRVPGCDTVLRLAHRIYHGRSVEQAAAREYAYRWNLALDAAAPPWRSRPNAFASHYAPHLLGA